MSTAYWEKRINQIMSIISRFNPPLTASFLCIFYLINSITLRKKTPKLFNEDLDILSYQIMFYVQVSLLKNLIINCEIFLQQTSSE